MCRRGRSHVNCVCPSVSERATASVGRLSLRFQARIQQRQETISVAKPRWRLLKNGSVVAAVLLVLSPLALKAYGQVMTIRGALPRCSRLPIGSANSTCPSMHSVLPRTIHDTKSFAQAELRAACVINEVMSATTDSAAVADQRVRRPEQRMRVSEAGIARAVRRAGSVEHRHGRLPQRFRARQVLISGHSAE